MTDTWNTPPRGVMPIERLPMSYTFPPGAAIPTGVTVNGQAYELFAPKYDPEYGGTTFLLRPVAAEPPFFGDLIWVGQGT